jgi:2,5-diketo-D-gluconate reductase A
MHTVPSGDVAMPALGFGTWQLEGDVARELVGAALDLGYRHIDTAAAYRNEREVGAAIAASGVPRDEIFLTTKIWVDSFADGVLQKAAERSAERLGTTPDLLLLHWPKAVPSQEETIKALNEAKARGFTRAIGVSNFPSAVFNRAVELSEAPISTNQVEYHPYLSQKAVLAAARKTGASLTAWSPLAQGKIVGDPVLEAIAAAHGKTVGQVTLRWLVQQDGVVAIPRTSSAKRAAENFAIFDFALTEEEMARIHALASPEGRIGEWLDAAYQWDAA